jgi:hypothetical protein
MDVAGGFASAEPARIGFADLTCTRDRRRTCQSNRSSTRHHATRETGSIGPNRAARATDSIGTLLAQNASATRASSQRIRSQRKTARATERNHRMPDRFASVERPCVRGPVGAMKRRSGIVRRPAAPDSASAASERCRGREPQERRPISNRAVGGRHSVSSPEVAAGRAGRA